MGHTADELAKAVTNRSAVLQHDPSYKNFEFCTNLHLDRIIHFWVKECVS